jgi:hypothetical protein
MNVFRFSFVPFPPLMCTKTISLTLSPNEVSTSFLFSFHKSEKCFKTNYSANANFSIFGAVLMYGDYFWEM